MAAVSLFLLLLFHLSLGQEIPPPLGIAVPDPNDVIHDSCQCETRIFDETEMNGTVKFFLDANCTNSCTYEYYINPLPGYIVSLEDKPIRTDPTLFSTFYYIVESDDTNMIPMGYSDLLTKGSETPPGIGVIIKYKRMPRISAEYDFEFTFERIPVSELKKTCPQPEVNVTSTVQNISTAGWPDRGCTLRLQSDHPINMKIDGNYATFPMKASFQRNGTAFMPLPQMAPMLNVNKLSGYMLYTLPAGTDLLYRPAFMFPYPLDKGTSNLTLVSLDYDPCNCSTNYTIETGQTINVASVDEMSTFCPPRLCTYTINSTKKEDTENMNTFVIKTSHFSNTTLIRFAVDDEQTMEPEKWFGQNRLNILTADSFQIHYYSYSPEKDRGFSINITAVTQPHDCRCPSNYRKEISEKEDSLEMSIPPHCTYMMCRFDIRVPSDKYWTRAPDQMLHFEVDYKFHNEILHIVGEHELMLHAAPHPRNFAGDLQSNNSKVMVTYLRQGVRKALKETSELKMNWHWVTLNECSCGKTSLTAGPKWSSIYSPRYPQEYCENLNCTYSVKAPEGHHVKFMLFQFETESHRDILSIYEGKKTLFQLSGHRPNHTIEVDSDGQNAVVTFHSDDTITAKGFKLSYIAIPDVDYFPEAVNGGYLQGFTIVGAVLLVALFISLAIFLAYKRSFFKRSTVAAYSFLPKTDEIVVIDVVDKE